jgi:hypothetical protein
MTQRSTVKKFVLVCAGSSLVCTVLTLGLALWAWMTYGKHVYTASLIATTFFFFSTTVVLYEMSRPPQPIPPEGADADAGAKLDGGA